MLIELCSILAPVESPQLARKPSAYYWADIHQFITDDPKRILGCLVEKSQHAVELDQRHAWEHEIRILAHELRGLAGTVYLEFDVPRLGSRIDAVIICGPAIFPIEFKIGERSYLTAHRNQVWDYALDLKNFHAASHDAPIFPILLATAAPDADQQWEEVHGDGVWPRAAVAKQT